jgi:MFS transporter, DHA2 family, multidrug resistance protein
METLVDHFFVIVFQFSGGIYLAAANEMVGATALLHEDVLMAGYASLVGMALTFVFMLRLKMRFTSRFSFLVSISALIVANIICISTTSVPVLVATCFFAGIFRMWATFECNSTIQLWLTPKRDLSIFFCYIYLLVQSTILLSGLSSIYVSLFSNWEYIHWFIIGMLLVVMLLVILLFNNDRKMRPFPLFGIDWLGGFMWGLIILTINFICIYGEHYDWLHSTEIRTAVGFLAVLLFLNIWRASFIRHPFISLQTFKYKAVYLTFFLYIIVDIFIAPAHLIEHIYLEAVLHYDARHLVSLNWVGFGAVVVGALFSYYFFALKKHSYKSMFLVGFASIILYLMLMYFRIDYTTTKELLFVPVFFRNFGYVVIAIVLLTNLVKVPFHHFFQAVSVQAFVSAGFGGVLGTAILHHFMNVLTSKNFMLLSSGLDHVNHKLLQVDMGAVFIQLQGQVLLVSFKELYGYLVIAAFVSLLLFTLYKYPYYPRFTLYPKRKTIVKFLKREIA